jgi:peptidoglycan/LPS O-acetylase OafA/YrhL
VSVAYRAVVISAQHVHAGHSLSAGAANGIAVTMPNWLPGYGDMFAFGMFLAVYSAWTAQTGRSAVLLDHPLVPWLSWAVAAALFAAVSNIGLPTTPVTASPVGLSLARQTLYTLFAFFVVAPAVVGPQTEGLPRRMLQTRPLVFLGTVSYGIYLWHESWIETFLRRTGDRIFAISFPGLLLTVTMAATVTAALSYYLLERPMIRARLRSPGHSHLDIPSGEGAVATAAVSG